MRCRMCRYVLDGISIDHCPECGTPRSWRPRRLRSALISLPIAAGPFAAAIAALFVAAESQVHPVHVLAFLPLVLAAAPAAICVLCGRFNVLLVLFCLVSAMIAAGATAAACLAPPHPQDFGHPMTNYVLASLAAGVVVFILSAIGAMCAWAACGARPFAPAPAVLGRLPDVDHRAHADGKKTDASSDPP